MRVVVTVMLILCAGLTMASDQLSDEDQARYRALIAELRCLVCQNQNIAESTAPLAEDLKTQVSEMIADGRSDDQIIAYLTDRYGDFVLYRPPLKPATLALWLGPILLLLMALLVVWRISRRRVAGSHSSDQPGAQVDQIIKRLDDE